MKRPISILMPFGQPSFTLSGRQPQLFSPSGGVPAGSALIWSGTNDPQLSSWSVNGTVNLVQIGNDVYDTLGGGNIDGISASGLGIAGVLHMDSFSSQNIGSFDFSGNSLTGVTGGALVQLGDGGEGFDFSDNAMSIAACEQLAIDLANNSGIGDGGTLNVSGQSPAAPLTDWSSEGQSAVAALTAAGWTVSTD